MTKAAAVLSLLIFISICSAFDVAPESPNAGDTITLTGTAAPGDQVTFRSSFAMDLDASAGQYEYETRVAIPQKPNRFTVTARNVKDLNAGVKLGIWISRRFEASGGIATISQADVPAGSYHLKMFGEALPGAANVPVEVVAETTVTADVQGRYNLVIDTSGIPAGDYRIEAAGEARTLHMGGRSAASTSSESLGNNAVGASQAEQKPRSEAITPDVVRWYAAQIHMDISNSSQYDDAVELLKKRLSGGYWLVIAQGEPLTEEAGSCEQKFCLVRGIDACTTCREKDMQMRSGGSAGPVVAEENDTAGMQNTSLQASVKGPEEKKGFISEAMDWVWRLLGSQTGG